MHEHHDFDHIIISFGMAMDFAKGAGEREPKLTQALKGGLFFGVIEGFVP